MPFLLLGLALAACIAFARWASGRYESVMRKGNAVNAPTAHTGAEIALKFLQFEGVEDVQVVEHDAMISDYFDPARRRLFLRRKVAHGTSLAAWAVALHEAAHAIQTGEALGGLKWRQSCVRMSRYLPTFVGIVAVALMVFRILIPRLALMVIAAALLAILLLNAGSLPTEFNANKRLRRFLEEYLKNHPQAHSRLEELLFGMALREAGDALNSPRYFFFSALPGTSRSRPG